MEGYKNKTLANVIRNNAIKFPFKNIEGYLIKQHKKCSDEKKSKKIIINGCLKRTLVLKQGVNVGLKYMNLVENQLDKKIKASRIYR